MLKHTFLSLSVFLVLFSSQAATNSMQYSFEKFAYNDKLPSNSVIRIFHDKEGYMWFGTKDGLCRFDGYVMKVIRSSALTPGKLTNNEIQCIAEDNDQRIWVGTYEGINIIDKKNYTIKSLNNIYTKKERINSLVTDSKGFVWVGTSDNGVLCIDPNTNKFVRYSRDENSTFKLKGNNITNIYEDKQGKIWLSLWKKGLCCIDQSRKHISFAPVIGNNDNPFRLFQDKDGLFWICTWGDGIFQMTDINAKMNIRPMVASKNSTGKIDEIVYSITQDDKYKALWVVTFKGLSQIEKLADGTCKVSGADSFFDETTNKFFHEITKDRNGNLWLGTVGDGLFMLDFNKLAIRNYPLSEIKNSLNIPTFITRFCELTTGELYIVINRIGIFRFNPKTGEIKRPADPSVRSISSIFSIINATSDNEIWVSNEGEDIVHVCKNNAINGLVQVGMFSLSNFKNSKENSITNFFKDSKNNIWIGSANGLFLKPLNGSLVQVSSHVKYANAMGQDARGNIWIGTDKDGAFLCNPAQKDQKGNYIFKNVVLSVNNYQSFSVQSICCQKSGDVYIGTKEGCIYYFNSAKQTIADISGLYGITDEGIMDILEDNYGLLWISTNKKIIRYNPLSHAATYFSSADGMMVSSFFKEARVKLKSGQILFGGNNGICAFDPLKPNALTTQKKQHVVLTDILIQNKSIFDDEQGSHYDADRKRVTLKNSESNLSIEFSALDFVSSGKIQYVYKLSGVDNNWVYVGNNRRFVNYANLPPGKYKFMVKANDENGLWSDQVTTLEIVILPPLYQTWWAYLAYIIILGVIMFFASRIVVNRLRLRNELKISRIEKEKTEELAQIKLRYFTNISHELLTPLTIIMLLIESLQKKYNDESTQFEMMKGNIVRLKRLIQQILVFRKTESGNMKLNISKNDIIAFVNNICQSNFQPLVEEKNISFSIESEHDTYMAYFDPDKLDKILYNLLSNAFKHTSIEGRISVKIDFVPQDINTILRLSVTDSGVGISEEDLPHIFKRFYISTSSDQGKSHGIGLALTSDLLSIHHGTISVASKVGEGAEFTIEIPVNSEAYSEEEMTEENENQPSEFADTVDTTEVHNEITEEIEGNEDVQKQSTILVVEDNKELNNLVVQHFSDRYNVLSAENGIEALEVIRKNEIDLLISDVMMPEMDGLTLCTLIKNDVLTSHINVLLLTAKNSTEDRVECYNAGADAYIAKPFELEVLDARVRNLMSKRRQKTENFQKNQEINISSMEYGSIDEDFLKQAVSNVEKKLSDENFDFDQFALDMALSKSTLHRKLKSLTGLSPGEFIRNIRLKHAVQMITSNSGNISEIAFAVGFNDPKYFSRCFKNEFGVTPREYQEAKRQQ